MKRAWLLAALATVSPTASAEPVKELAHRVRGSVVLLTILDASGRELGSGTGFAIEGDLVATNHHVVDEARGIRATTSSDETFDALGVVAADEENDLAILRFPHTLRLTPLPARAEPVEPGDPVVVVGNPLGLSGTVSEGIVSAIRKDGIADEPEYRRPLIQITAPISPGSSGSPVFDVDGRVIGVAALIHVRGQNLNFAIPVDILEHLRASADGSKLATTYGKKEARRELYRNLGISLLFFVVIIVVVYRMRDG